MDQLMVAVRGPFQKEIKKGEEVVIFGRQGNEEIKLKDVFSKLGHWNIIATSINRRVPRIYLYDGKVKKVVNLLK